MPSPPKETAGDIHRRAGGGTSVEVALHCTTVQRARDLKTAFDNDHASVIRTGRENKVLTVEFKSIRKAIVSLHEHLGLTVNVNEMNPSGGPKWVKRTHLEKLLKQEVPKANGVKSAVFDPNDYLPKKSTGSKGAGRPKSSWTLHCEGIETVSWTMGSKIIPSILFDKVLGSSDAAKAIKSKLEELVKEHLSEKRGAPLSYTKEDVSKWYRTKDRYRKVLTRLIHSGVCHLFEDSVSGAIDKRTMAKGMGKGKAKGKGPRVRSASVGRDSTLGTKRSRTLKKKKSRSTSRSHGKQPRSHGKQPRSHGKQPRSHGKQPRSHGKQPPNLELLRQKGGAHREAGVRALPKGGSKGGPKGLGNSATHNRLRATIYNNLKNAVRTRIDFDMSEANKNAFLDRMVALHRKVRETGSPTARAELEKNLKPLAIPTSTSPRSHRTSPRASPPVIPLARTKAGYGNAGPKGDPKAGPPSRSKDESNEESRKHLRKAFGLGFALCKAGLNETDLTKKQMRRHLKGNKRLRQALGSSGSLRKYVRSMSRSISRTKSRR